MNFFTRRTTSQPALQLVLFCVFLASCGPVQAQNDASRATPEPGTYTAYTNQSRTRMDMGYAVGTGYRLSPRTVISRQKSALGDLVLRKDGRYSLPRIGGEGTWRFDADSQSLTFSGALQGIENHCSVRHGSYVVTLRLRNTEGSYETYAFEKPARAPIPDLSKPNNFRGELLLFDGSASFGFDLASGQRSFSFHSVSPGWLGRSEELLHVGDENPYSRSDPIRVEIRKTSGDVVTEFRVAGTDSSPFHIGDFWHGEVSPNGKHVLLNGTSKIEVDKRTSIFEVNRAEPIVQPAVRITDRHGKLITEFLTPGPFTATWLDDAKVIYANDKGGASVHDIALPASSNELIENADDIAISGDGDTIAVRRGNRVEFLNLATRQSQLLKYQNKPMEFNDVAIQAMRWSPDGNAILFVITDGSEGRYTVLVAERSGETAEYIRTAQGDPIVVPSPMVSWIR